MTFGVFRHYKASTWRSIGICSRGDLRQFDCHRHLVAVCACLYGLLALNQLWRFVESSSPFRSTSRTTNASAAPSGRTLLANGVLLGQRREVWQTERRGSYRVGSQGRGCIRLATTEHFHEHRTEQRERDHRAVDRQCARNPPPGHRDEPERQDATHEQRTGVGMRPPIMCGGAEHAHMAVSDAHGFPYGQPQLDKLESKRARRRGRQANGTPSDDRLIG